MAGALKLAMLTAASKRSKPVRATVSVGAKRRRPRTRTRLRYGAATIRG